MEVKIYTEVCQLDKTGSKIGMYLMEALENDEPVMVNGEPYIIHEIINAGHICTTKLHLNLMIKALNRLNRADKILVITDCEAIYYAIINGWYINWKNNDWNNAKGIRIKYMEEWEKLTELLKKYEVTVSNEWHSYRQWMKNEMLAKKGA